VAGVPPKGVKESSAAQAAAEKVGHPPHPADVMGRPAPDAQPLRSLLPLHFGFANSPLVSQIEFKSNTTVRLTTTKSYDKLNRLTSIASVGTGSTPSVSSHTYSYNDANQRTRVNLADGSFWIYEYDPLGQVKSGKRYWSDGTPVAGQQFEYAHDDIGNRTTAKAGGDAAGANLRSAGYTPNRLNQYAGRTVPGAVDAMGAAKATASVTVNSVAATVRKGEYFWKEVSVANGSVPVWQSLSITATEGANNQTTSGNVFVPKSAEAYTYDLDGNLLTDGRWTHTWDAENRLVRMVPNTTVGPQTRIDFEYDWQGRRIAKKVWNNTAGTSGPKLSERFLYDGWNLIAQLNATNNAVVRSYVWGSDISGSMQGAGGVGGLLAVKDTANGTHFAAYDGNGNVAALVRAADASVSARYEYGPFGELIRASGTAAKTNPFRFSTKFQDDETDLLYYGYRFYNPSTGRWPSRDPIGEEGGANEFGVAGNDVVNHIDILGKDFIAVAGRAVGNTLGTLGHYSLQHWLSCGTDAPEEQYSIAYWTRNHPASKLASVELLASGGWHVGVMAPTPSTRSTSVSVISIGPPFMDSGTVFVSVFAGTRAEVRARWNVIRHLAENYEFAEQGGLAAFAGPFINWPNSKYGFPHDGPFNNSNTFVRDTTHLAGLTMRELTLIPGGFPGNDVPVNVPDIYVSVPSR